MARRHGLAVVASFPRNVIGRLPGLLRAVFNIPTIEPLFVRYLARDLGCIAEARSTRLATSQQYLSVKESRVRISDLAIEFDTAEGNSKINTYIRSGFCRLRFEVLLQEADHRSDICKEIIIRTLKAEFFQEGIRP